MVNDISWIFFIRYYYDDIIIMIHSVCFAYVLINYFVVLLLHDINTTNIEEYRPMIETATYIGLVVFGKLINRTVYALMLRHFGTTNTVPKQILYIESLSINYIWPKCLKFFRWCRSVSCRSVHETLQHQCRNVLGPKCLRSEVSVHCPNNTYSSSYAYIIDRRLYTYMACMQLLRYMKKYNIPLRAVPDVSAQQI